MQGELHFPLEILICNKSPMLCMCCNLCISLIFVSFAFVTFVRMHLFCSFVFIPQITMKFLLLLKSEGTDMLFYILLLWNVIYFI